MDKIEIKVGETYGEGKEARTVTRITETMVYWKRPGGKERRVGKYMPNFREWVASLDRTVNKTEIGRIVDAEDFLSTFPEDTKGKGFVRQIDNKITIEFEIQQ